ncbi:hypothetical protein [Amycolatopsis minnesotensis]|uniref:Uncharacterized protein n=1 Tax=Amycolatopsis minnesotensis TaxID=337894 RepID=A0ABP5CDY3_9PSEU
MSRAPRRGLDRFEPGNADRKSRSQRTTVMVCWLIAEIMLGGTLLIWSSSEVEAERTIMGPIASAVVVISTMSLLTWAVVAVALAHRLKRPILLLTTIVTAVSAGWLVVAAIGAWGTNAGVSTLLTFACVLTLPIVLGVTRAESVHRNARNQTGNVDDR